MNSKKPSLLSGMLGKLFGSSPETLYRRGVEQAKKKQIDKAIQTYTQVLRLDSAPADIRAMSHLSRAMAYISQRQNGPARKDLEQVLAMPDVPADVRKTAEDKLSKMNRRLGHEA